MTRPLLALVLAAGVAAAALARGPARSGTERRAPQPPPIVARAPVCRSTGSAAEATCARLQVVASAHLARTPVSPADGLSALRLLEEAAACARVAARADAESRLSALAARTRVELVERRRAELLRLRIADLRGDADAARGAVSALEGLDEERDGPYSAWLSVAAARWRDVGDHR